MLEEAYEDVDKLKNVNDSIDRNGDEVTNASNFLRTEIVSWTGSNNKNCLEIHLPDRTMKIGFAENDHYDAMLLMMITKDKPKKLYKDPLPPIVTILVDDAHLLRCTFVKYIIYVRVRTITTSLTMFSRVIYICAWSRYFNIHTIEVSSTFKRFYLLHIHNTT